MLKARIVTALALLAAFLGAVFGLPAAGWLIFVALIAAACAWEWAGLMREQALPPAAFSFVTAVLLLAQGAMVLQDRLLVALALYVAGCLLWFLMAPLWLARKWRPEGVLSAAIVGWLVILPACVALVQLRQLSPWLLLAAMALVWVADIAAYAAGRLFGRRKLAPSISPCKTWSGAAGAALGVLVYGFAILAGSGAAGSLKIPQALAFAIVLLLLTGFSIMGDLFESLMKRLAGVKDSGRLLPGHGGILDRVDSLTSTLPWWGLALTLREWW